MTFRLYRSNTVQQPTNRYYPICETISNAEQLRRTVTFDHIACECAGSHRHSDNFLSSDCVVLDIDNDETNRSKYQYWDNPEHWTNLKDVIKDLPTVEFYAVTSRSHAKSKVNSLGDTRPARPKMHIYFPVPEFHDLSIVTTTKKSLVRKFKYYDPAVSSAVGFLYGNPDAQVYHHKGYENILYWTIDHATQEPEPPMQAPRRDYPKQTPAEPGKLLDLEEVLYSISPAALSYADWIYCGAVLHKLGLGVELWDSWSRQDGRYRSNDCTRRWESFDDGKCRAGAGWLIRFAKKHGYKPHR